MDSENLRKDTPLGNPASPELEMQAQWPQGVEGRIVFLLDASSPLEQQLLVDWIAASKPADVPEESFEWIAITPSRRRRRDRGGSALSDLVAAGEEALMVPLRLAWLTPPADPSAVGVLGWSDILFWSDPRDPGRWRQRWIHARHPERCHVVIAEPATLEELRQRWRRGGGTDVAETTGLGEFIERQAALALERAERRIRGARYKVPMLVYEDILGRPSFRGGLARLARSMDEPREAIAKEAGECLREIAATHSPFVIDLVAQFIRRLYRRSYGEALEYDHARLQEIYALAQRHPVVFLPSHKSNLDHLVLQYALHENGHPPNHTAGGINMNFFPLGPLVRRSGVFFIRRTFKDSEVYKFVLRSYIDYLIEKRFSLEWYIEGGRSRSGKLLPPRFGLLAYVVDAFLRGKSDDVILVPVSIAYDQIQDLGDYVAEQRGGDKESEGVSWLLHIIRRLSRKYGRIHLRFADPISLRELGAANADLTDSDSDLAPDPDREPALELRKLAFEVCVRINSITPITPTSLVTLAMLGAGDRALSLGDAVAVMRNLVDYVERRELPVTERLDVDNLSSVRAVLDDLTRNGVLACYDKGQEPVWMIRGEEHLAAAYYRNTIIHFFINGAIGEIAGLAAAEAEDLDSEGRAVDREAVFWEAAFGLRDLLKFEFFFAPKAQFRVELEDEMTLHDSDWKTRVASGSAGAREFVRRIRPFNAHRVLRPFLEGYQVVGDALASADPTAKFEPAKFLSGCLTLGKQYRLQHRVVRGESVSKVLFETALKLAGNRRLLDGLLEANTLEASAEEADALRERRRDFSHEIREAVKRCEAIDTLARSRRAGLLD
jgi:glycerol-3-phosphate O-acyltransferase